MISWQLPHQSISLPCLVQRYGGSFLSWMEQQEDADLAAAAAAVDGVDASDLQSKVRAAHMP